MYEGLYEAIIAEHERTAAWADAHAWEYEQLRAPRRSYRACIAQLLRVLAERIAPMTKPQPTVVEVESTST